MLSERLLLFYAQSGAGKSSLLHTRLIPQLQEEKGFVVLPVGRVGGDLPAGVEQVENIFIFNLMLSIDAGGDPARLAHVTLTDFLARLARRTVTDATGQQRKGWVYDATLAPAPAAAGPGARHYAMIIDQFEEIITVHPDRWPEREEFFRQLNQAIEADPNLWIVLTLREDYIAALDPYASLLADHLRARFYMERMGVEAGLDAIRRPAELAGRPFADGVAEQLADNLRQIRVPGQETTIAGQYVEPVQLQVVCYQLWENIKRRPPGLITKTDLQEAGDVDRALTQFYEDTLAAVLAGSAAPVTERRIRTWFDKELITDEGTRGLVHQDKTETGGLPNDAVQALQKRFLVRAEARSGDTWIELVHDRFVEPIRHSNRAWFARNQNPLTRAAQAWQEAGRPESKLYTGSQLAAAAAQLQASPADFGDVEKAFVEAGQQVEAHRASRRQRAIVWGAAALSLVFIALAVWALVSREEARNSEAKAVAEGYARATEVVVRATAEANAVKNANLAATREAEAKVAEASARNANATAQAERGVAVNAKATAQAERSVAQANANLAATREAEARSAQGEVERLTRGIRADQLTINTLRVADKKLPLALLLAVEGMRAQSDFTTTVVITEPVTPQTTVPMTHTAVVSETVVTSALANVHELLRKVEGVPGVPLPDHSEPVNAVAFSPDGRWLATASDDHTARLWNVADPTAAPRVLQHDGYVFDVAFSPDGRWLATGSDDNTARLWNVADPAAAPRVLQHDDTVSVLAFSPDGRWLATGSADRDKKARLWDVADPTAAPRVLKGHKDAIFDVAFSPDGRWLATGSNDGTARLWNIAEPKADARVLQHDGYVSAVAFSPDGRWLATGSADSTARLWDVADPTAAPRILQGHDGYIYTLAFSPDGRWLATGSADNTARLWNVADPTAPPRVLQGHERAVYAVAFSPDGRWLATGSASGDNTARLWNVADPAAAPRVLKGHKDAILDVAFSPDGRWLATGSRDKTAWLWDVTDPTAFRPLQGHDRAIYALAFSPNGRWLATASDDNTARLWDVADPAAAPRVLQGHANTIFAVAFSPDGRWLATGSDDSTARLWDVADPTAAPRILQGHESWITAVAFSPDGRWLATGSADHTARLWDVTDPTAPPRILQGHENTVYAVAFSPDGRWLATGSADNTARLWNLADPSTAPPRPPGPQRLGLCCGLRPGRPLAGHRLRRQHRAAVERDRPRGRSSHPPGPRACCLRPGLQPGQPLAGHRV